LKKNISFYIPAYNAEKTIAKSITSIQNQSISPDEIILIDDCSKDKTIEIVRSEYPNIKIFINKENMGLGYNRNLAIDKARNDIVAAIDADVILDKYWLENLMPEIEKKNVLMCGGRMDEQLIENKINLWRAKYYSQNWGNKLVLNPPFLFGCNTILKRSVWKKVNGYDEKLKTNGEDISFIHKIKSGTDGQIIYQPSAKCFHLQDDSIESLSKRVWRYHSFAYKIKEPSFKKLLKLSIKQSKFFFQRFFKSLIEFDLSGISISFKVFINFIKLEYIFLNKKK
tara:strand:- start:3002 stop:3850 length:849 start_codon:yes stop_codon:yes gene_type:complete